MPSDGWAQLLLYRKDLFEKAGLKAPETYDDLEQGGRKLKTADVSGITLATAPGDSFTQQTFEHLALANGCQLVDDAGNITLTSPNCVEAFQTVGDLAKKYGPAGNQDVDSTRATYFAGKAAMTVWSSYILDELAGLRNDALPTCPQCRADKRFLANNTGIVAALSGPNGGPAQYGEIISFAITDGADPATKDFVQYMMSDAYLRVARAGARGQGAGPQGHARGARQVPEGLGRARGRCRHQGQAVRHLRSGRAGRAHQQPQHLPALGHPAGQGRTRRGHAGRAARCRKALNDLLNGKVDAAGAARRPRRPSRRSTRAWSDHGHRDRNAPRRSSDPRLTRTAGAPWPPGTPGPGWR